VELHIRAVVGVLVVAILNFLIKVLAKKCEPVIISWSCYENLTVYTLALDIGLGPTAIYHVMKTFVLIFGWCQYENDVF